MASGAGEGGALAAKVDISVTAYEDRTGELTRDTAFGHAALQHRAHGVMAVLGPYNFPAHLPNGQIIPALIAGNTVVFKPSEQTPAVGETLIKLYDEAGFPKGVINMVQGARETGAAAQAAASIIAQSAFITTGQRCTCARRLIVPNDARGEAIIEAVTDFIDRMTLGAWNEEATLGPLISADIAGHVVKNANALGGKAIRAASISDKGAAYVTPGFCDVTGLPSLWRAWRFWQS